MFSIDSILRPHLKSLRPYTTARDEFKGVANVFLDANENSLGGVIHGFYSRYPDPHQSRIKSALAKLRGIDERNIFVGHGSDEAIELLIRAVCEPGKDAVITMPPTYGMYGVSAGINNVEIVEVPLTDDYQIDLAAVLKNLSERTKLVFCCSPNNPTGNLLRSNDIREICRATKGLVVVDEAYIDFTPENSLLRELKSVPNLVVLQTLSKAWGLAGLRVGFAFGDERLMAALDKIKPPYNLSAPTQALALRALARKDRQAQMVKELVAERENLRAALQLIPGVKKIAPSDANFLLVTVEDADGWYEKLLSGGIVVRNRSTVEKCAGALRITVGSRADNRKLLAVLSGEDAPNEKIARRGTVRRETNETRISVDLFLDGKGEAAINTGVGFFDHMLEQVAKHSGIDLAVMTEGDLDFDVHHTIEDTAIALGEALRLALGDKRGIERYGFTAPMDEAQASVALDFSGRPHLEWNVVFTREMVGDLPTEMVKHFFSSFADAARCTLHVSCTGENEHHKIEGIFKALARALRDAVRKTGDELPSTKGKL